MLLPLNHLPTSRVLGRFLLIPTVYKNNWILVFDTCYGVIGTAEIDTSYFS